MAFSTGVKNELDVIYDHIIEGLPSKSKCDWNKHSKKSNLFFLNLKMQRVPQIYRLKKFLFKIKITDKTHILKHIREFYETLFKIRGKNCDGNGKNFHVC